MDQFAILYGDRFIRDAAQPCGHQLVHRVGRSSQATTAAVDKFPRTSNTKFRHSPERRAPRRPFRRYAQPAAEGAARAIASAAASLWLAADIELTTSTSTHSAHRPQLGEMFDRGRACSCKLPLRPRNRY